MGDEAAASVCGSHLLRFTTSCAHTHTDAFEVTKVELRLFRRLMVQSVNIRVRVKGGVLAGRGGKGWGLGRKEGRKEERKKERKKEDHRDRQNSRTIYFGEAGKL